MTKFNIALNDAFKQIFEKNKTYINLCGGLTVGATVSWDKKIIVMIDIVNEEYHRYTLEIDKKLEKNGKAWLKKIDEFLMLHEEEMRDHYYKTELKRLLNEVG